MKTTLTRLVTLLAALACSFAFAQEPRVTGDQDGSSQQVEESDEAYRRRMELEDARHRDPTYTDPAGTWSQELEKIDKLPPESRDNIRDQLVDVIMANPEWKPGDALEEFPYEPTAAAQNDADLLEREQAAWDEQIEKYHAREAEAFGAYRGPAAGPGNPAGGEGGDGEGEGEPGSPGGQSGEGQQGREGGGEQQRTAGTYQPQNGQRDEGPATQGVSESALDFLMARQGGSEQADRTGGGQQSPSAAPQPPGDRSSPGEQQSSSQNTAQASSAASQPRAETDGEPEPTEPDMRGIIAIEDLDKLEGAVSGGVVRMPPEEDEPENPDGR